MFNKLITTHTVLKNIPIIIINLDQIMNAKNVKQFYRKRVEELEQRIAEKQ